MNLWNDASALTAGPDAWDLYRFGLPIKGGAAYVKLFSDRAAEMVRMLTVATT